ncbi:MAG: Fe-S cluster assembly protein SufD [Bacteroidales bacterium]|nr:Fe-S cluster assembly protein SufD [Bacteroidales bacterium]
MNGLNQKWNNSNKGTNMEGIKESLVRLYEENEPLINTNVGSALKQAREKALADFDRLGIPTRKNEAYKYTNIEPVLEVEHSAEFTADAFKIKLEEVFKCEVPELDTHVVLVLNGFYYHDNKLSGLPQGVIVTSLAQASVIYPEIFNRHYGKYANTSEDSLAALNTFFAQDGVFIYVPKNVKIDRPIQIINLCYTFKNLRITRRNLVIAEDGSDLQVIVCDHTLCNKSYLTNSLIEMYAGENAKIDFTRLQNENNLSSQITNSFIQQETNSRVKSTILSLHGGFIRNNVYVNLNGEGADNNTLGLFIGDSKQHTSNFTLINHLKPHCTSNQLYKGILNDEATGAFNGKIYVGNDAQKTMAYQKNNNILLSSTAKMNSKPQLEIYADDVKCSHGATVGQLDNDALFYLRSRGIPEKEARHLLMYAFANEVISQLDSQHLKERIIALLDKRLRGELAKCEGCEISCG